MDWLYIDVKKGILCTFKGKRAQILKGVDEERKDDV